MERGDQERPRRITGKGGSTLVEVFGTDTLEYKRYEVPNFMFRVTSVRLKIE